MIQHRKAPLWQLVPLRKYVPFNFFFFWNLLYRRCNTPKEHYNILEIKIMICIQWYQQAKIAVFAQLFRWSRTLMFYRFKCFLRQSSYVRRQNAFEHLIHLFRVLVLFRSDVVNDKTLFPTNVAYAAHDWHDTVDAVRSIDRSIPDLTNWRWRCTSKRLEVPTNFSTGHLVQSNHIYCVVSTCVCCLYHICRK